MGGLCLKRHEVEADFRVHPPLHPAPQKGDHQLAGGADDGPVQVPAEDPALLVADAHMEMTIGLVLLGGEGAVERDDLIFSLELVGFVLLGGREVNAHRHIIRSAQAVH